MSALLWFRRDLRLHDHPALLAAAEQGPVVALFVLDDALLASSGPARTAFLLRSLQALDADLQQHGGALVLRRGRPEEVVPAVAREAGAAAVHISTDYAPYGVRRDARVAQELPVPLVGTGSPYAVAPGRVRTQQGGPFQVFTPFFRAWQAHGWRAPADSDPAVVTWRTLPSEELPPEPPDVPDLPPAGEQAALTAWHAYDAATYDDVRDRPDLDATSSVSAYLKWGTLHPRTLLADLGPAEETFRRELAWREFFAAALHTWPRGARHDLRPAGVAYPESTEAEQEERFAAWCAGRTGYPFVDAGLRQLLATGWMHNRVRMVVASFLVKDLGVPWQWGARHFMQHLVDGDLASNQMNWQWVAGCGLDAAPYHRIFNPISQGRKFDPDGVYVRRWVPELASAGDPHEPVDPIVDHAEQRRAALEAYRARRA